MAFTGNFMCTSFKQQLLEGAHDFRATGGDIFYIALYTNSASFTAARISGFPILCEPILSVPLPLGAFWGGTSPPHSLSSPTFTEGQAPFTLFYDHRIMS